VSFCFLCLSKKDFLSRCEWGHLDKGTSLSAESLSLSFCRKTLSAFFVFLQKDFVQKELSLCLNVPIRNERGGQATRERVVAQVNAERQSD